jgi:hypothetical protein
MRARGDTYQCSVACSRPIEAFLTIGPTAGASNRARITCRKQEKSETNEIGPVLTHDEQLLQAWTPTTCCCDEVEAIKKARRRKQWGCGVGRSRAREHIGTHCAGSCGGAWMYAALHILRIYTSAIAPPAIVCGCGCGCGSTVWLCVLSCCAQLAVRYLTGYTYNNAVNNLHVAAPHPTPTLCDVRSAREGFVWLWLLLCLLKLVTASHVTLLSKTKAVLSVLCTW